MSNIVGQAFPVARVPFADSYSIGMSDDDDDMGMWSLSVKYRGPGDRWAVSRLGRVLGVDGTWDFEPSPSNRPDGWKEAYRFPLAEAMRLALLALLEVRVNGMTWAQWKASEVSNE